MDAAFTAEILQARVDQLETENKSLKAKLKLLGNKGPITECCQCQMPLIQDEQDTNGNKCHICADDIRELKNK